VKAMRASIGMIRNSNGIASGDGRGSATIALRRPVEALEDLAR
jgi:hypothetical protein